MVDRGLRSVPRRRFLAGAAGTVLLGGGGGAVASAKAAPGGAAPRLLEFRLTAREASASIVGDDHPDTRVWAYDSMVPGPELRVRQGDRMRIVVENRLREETTVHWHGLRLENRYDGVPGETQTPIPPGGDFTYRLAMTEAVRLRVVADKQRQLDLFQQRQQARVPARRAFRAGRRVAALRQAARIAEAGRQDGDAGGVVEDLAPDAEPVAQALAGGVVEGGAGLVRERARGLARDQQPRARIELEHGLRAERQMRGAERAGGRWLGSGPLR